MIFLRFRKTPQDEEFKHDRDWRAIVEYISTNHLQVRQQAIF